MANYTVTANPASTYPPASGAPADVVAHENDHGSINGLVNLFDTSMAAAAAGFVPVWSGSGYVSRALLSTDNPSVVANTRTASYTLVLADAGKLVEMFVASANTLTVPPNSLVGFPVGSQIAVRQYGAGITTIAGGTGVTIHSRGSIFTTAGMYAEATLTKRATDEWILSGDLA